MKWCACIPKPPVAHRINGWDLCAACGQPQKPRALIAQWLTPPLPPLDGYPPR